MKIIAGIAAIAALSGCNSLNQALAERHETIEMYHIYDIRTAADNKTIAKAIADGIAQNTNSVNTVTPLQIGRPVPTEPGRFTLEDPVKGIRIPGVAMPKVAVCSDAVWTAQANRNTGNASALSLQFCLFKYREGYHLDVYATFRKASGVSQLPAALAEKLVGSAEQWVTKTIVDTVREIGRVPGTAVRYVEGQPELADLPLIDKVGQK
ncbi:hypothetical protein [Pseudoduganella sp.]|uniref:hypothetical protein n=1 Tax=Pseudoduganella sp. TaxID=1880898 RepID=UPI0035B1B2B6